jgi:two-component system, cell cycle sensor histidine kinase PleC
MDSVEKELFEHFPYAQIVLTVVPGEELTLALCNPAAAALYGMNPHQVVGKQLHHVLVRAMADFLEQEGQRCVKEQKLIISAPQELHPITDAKQSFTFNPLFDKSGLITHISITALPYEADKLELQKERDHALMLMSSAFDASSLGVFVTDKNRRVLRVNEAFLREFGFRRRDVIGRDFTTVYAQADRKSVGKAYKDFLRGQSETRHEWSIQGPNGKQADVLVTTAPLHLHPDRPLVVHTLVDISEHKHLEESLRWAKEQADSANRAKSTFLAGMSHELRTPLNAILGFSELMQNETFGAMGHAKYAEYMNDIHFAANHLLEIINDVLDMSKIEAGKFELIEQSIDVKNLFDSVLRVMADRAEMAGVILHSTIDEALITIYADKRVLRQMLFNLVSNAIKFSRFSEEIFMSAIIDPVTSEIRLSVKDQGPGMESKDIDKMLEPFNQGQSGINDGTGTGLGLPLTRAMAELHDGRLVLESVTGSGTTATIVLPPERNISAKTKTS